MLRKNSRILWSIALLLLFSSTAWGQERVYDPDGKFSVILPQGWSKKANRNQFNKHNELTLRSPAGKGQVMLKARSLDGWKSRPVPPVASFQVSKSVDDGDSQRFTQVTGKVVGGPNSDGDKLRGEVSASYFAAETSEAQLKVLMDVFHSFRLEDSSKAKPMAKPVNDDF